MSLMSLAEVLFSAAVAFLFWQKKLHLRFPAMASYLALRVVSAPVLFLLLTAYNRTNLLIWDEAYFFAFYAIYIASAILLFFICTEVFRSALSGFPGIMKIGLVIFRWAALVSLIITFSTVSFAHKGLMIIPDIAFGLMRSVSVLELCLLGFLCLCLNTLRLSVRDFSFGISLGFGIVSANDFIVTSLISSKTAQNAPIQFVYQSMILVSLAVWAAYCALPERASAPVVMPANSTIYRWNEIASALGHTGTQVAIQQPAHSFFLTDVEKVVDKVLTRSLKGRESES
jgi:hypothetical protein